MAEDIEVKVAEVDQRSKGNAHRLDKLEERQDNLDRLVSSVSALATEQDHIKTDVAEIKGDVKTLTEKPGKRWDSVVTAIITGVVAFILGLALNGSF